MGNTSQARPALGATSAREPRTDGGSGSYLTVGGSMTSGRSSSHRQVASRNHRTEVSPDNAAPSTPDLQLADGTRGPRRADRLGDLRNAQPTRDCRRRCAWRYAARNNIRTIGSSWRPLSISSRADPPKRRDTHSSGGGGGHRTV